LGAFEYGLNPPPFLAITHAADNLIFTGAAGPDGGTNYLVATTNLSPESSQWVRVATNQFDLAGHCAITNGIPIGLPQRFYRISLQ
jgi:hypothetical protein